MAYITDGDGKVENRYEYDAWGNVMEAEEGIPNRFQFTGEQLDPVTQQYYLRARFYNPVIARFTQEDTYRGDGLNLYAYCRNNPVTYVDPSGQYRQCVKDAYDQLRRENPKMSAQDAYAEAKKVAPMDWNEFQSANKGKYNQQEMSDAWGEYKKDNYPNGGEHYLNRPYFRQDTVNGIEAGKGANGTYFDANTGEPIVGTPDIGHVPGHEFWRERDAAEAQNWTQSEFNDYMNKSEYYQYEAPSNNRSHKYENKDK